ncbi:hypothetical protein KZO25_19250 [Halomonas sp. ANAO-440]|uniref:hypothetical protein n=1 Tax=Halomonas sp. ANAO-440 TaxID=2861360 RepID=UPI001CAA80A0|nr:hypothetical protein [Halomonas sp. ANAO-440]MBZ0332451.1 hypothetical protein [Halomonas sp. ANAO-440]
MTAPRESAGLGAAVSLPAARWWRARGWQPWGVSLLLVVLLMVALTQGYRALQDRSDAPLFRVVVSGETLILDAETHAAFGRELAELTQAAHPRLLQEMQLWIDERVDASFAPLEAAVPAYLDWYFSLRGSYHRLGVAIVGDLDEWLEAQLTERLIEESGFASALAELQADFPTQLALTHQVLVEDIGRTLHARFADRQAAGTSDSADAIHTIDLDLSLSQAFQGQWDTARWGTAGAGAVVGFVTSRVLVQRLASGAAARGARVVAGRVVARLGVHGARSLAAGGTAAVATAPTGPGALLTGAAVALAGFAGTEYALLKAEEALYRAEMAVELEAEVTRAKAEVKGMLESGTTGSATVLEQQLEVATRRAEASGGVSERYRIVGGDG